MRTLLVPGMARPEGGQEGGVTFLVGEAPKDLIVVAILPLILPLFLLLFLLLLLSLFLFLLLYFPLLFLVSIRGRRQRTSSVLPLCLT